MTEQEYIDATNLAKLRTAYAILHDCLPMREKEQTQQREAKIALREWIDDLERIVAIEPDSAGESR